jgi:hypothetical protein
MAVLFNARLILYLILNDKNMDDKSYYRKLLEERYGLKRRSFLSGFFFMFGIGENPYKNSIKRILNTSVEEALRGDVRQLSMDCRRAMEKHKHELPELKTK